jgi:hypothetical protein
MGLIFSNKMNIGKHSFHTYYNTSTTNQYTDSIVEITKNNDAVAKNNIAAIPNTFATLLFMFLTPSFTVFAIK